MALTGGVDSTGDNSISTANRIYDYGAIFTSRGTGLIFRCVTGLGPTENTNNNLGILAFNDQYFENGNCNGPVIQARGATISTLAGVVNVYLCRGLTAATEGIYTCFMLDSRMQTVNARIGVYFPGRSKCFMSVLIFHLLLFTLEFMK